jgi:adenosylcobinamide-phosphate synthase
MTLFSILGALVWEQLMPLRDPSPPVQTFERYGPCLMSRVNAGTEKHGLLAWGLGALLPALVAAGIWLLLGDVLGWLWAVPVLYFTMGFKQYSFALASVAANLRSGDLDRARATLTEWRAGSVSVMTANELARVAIEAILRLALRRLLGVLFWFALLGVFGAVLYRLTHLFRDLWQDDLVFSVFPNKLVHWLDWLPVRAAAFSFAIVGDFEGAMNGWRNQAGEWSDLNEGVLFASGAGALGVRVGGHLNMASGELMRPELGGDQAADPEYMDGSVSLIWRVILLWLAILGLLWLGGL